MSDDNPFPPAGEDDPWGEPPVPPAMTAEEAQQNTRQRAIERASEAIDRKEAVRKVRQLEVISETEAGRVEITVTLKAGKGHEAPWIVVRGSTPEDVLRQFESGEVLEKLIREAAGASAAFQNEYEGRSGPVPPSGTVGKPASASVAPEGQERPSGDVPTCKHGKRKFVEHAGKRGYACQHGVKAERCRPVFI